jgi:hypothetical protein
LAANRDAVRSPSGGYLRRALCVCLLATRSWHKGRVFVSEVFRNEEIGLEQMDEDVHRVFFCNTELGEFNSSEMRFRPALRS